MSESDRSLSAATAALLKADAVIAAWCLALAAVSILCLVAASKALAPASSACFVAVAALGVLERYLAARIAFDAALFAALASTSFATVANLDVALVQLGAIRQAQPSRTVVDRARGARNLAFRHAAIACVQTALLVTAVAVR